MVDIEVSKPLQPRWLSLNNRMETYMHCENNQLLKHPQIDVYGMIQFDVNRSWAGKQDEETLQSINIGWLPK